MSGRAATPNLVRRERPFDAASYDVPHPAPFLLDLAIEPHHLGEVIEHVSNIEYVRWLDRAAELHSDALGYTRTRLLEENLMWFVARHEVDYLAETWLGDELVIATWVRDMRRIRSWRDFVIVRPADETVVCRAATLWVLVDLAARRPKRIPDEMARRFQPLVAPDGKPETEPAERGDPSCTSP